LCCKLSLTSGLISEAQGITKLEDIVLAYKRHVR